MDLKKICPNCFTPNMQYGYCSKCGYNKESRTVKTSNQALPEFTTLNERYLVGIVLGAGGFGITYKAYDLYNNMICAIKEYAPVGISVRSQDHKRMLPIDNGKSAYYEHGKKRFLEEAKVLKELSGIREVVRITDYFFQNNTGYFVMEYIEGTTVKKLMSIMGGRIPVQESSSIIYKVGNGLDKVHKRGRIFHRDVSADNILINVNGEVTLIDFGSAKYLVGQKSQNLSVVLKPGFAPPEQYTSNGKQGTYTDVYALASTYYYILTGNMIPDSPDRFSGQSYLPLKYCNLGINETVSDSVDQALELNYRNRTQTAGEFIQAIKYSDTQKQFTIKQFQSNKESDGEKQLTQNEKNKTCPTAYIEITEGSGKGKQWNIPANTILTIGRSSQYANIVLESDMKISKCHAELFFDATAGKLYIEDFSTNGVFINGVRVQKRAIYPLEQNQTFTIGKNICDIKWGVHHE